MTVSDQRLRPVYDALASGRHKVLSVDVFDTLLWRRVPEPDDVFLCLGQHLASSGKLRPHITPVAFAELRRIAQTMARERAFAATESREVTLNEIYAELPDFVFSADLSAAARVQTELELEQSLLLLDDDVAALMSHARACGAQVILVSDTYFSSNDIKIFLKAAGYVDFDVINRLYVSCEAGRPKFIDLFDVVLKELGIAPNELVHIGD
ncbi:MAG: hypothetical protein RLN70_11630, partial [Rhodospirillaceae bacterium]